MSIANNIKFRAKVQIRSLAALEEEDGNLAKVEVDEVAGLMCDIRTKVTANYAMPSWVVLLVKLLLDECSNILKGSIKKLRTIVLFKQ